MQPGPGEGTSPTFAPRTLWDWLERDPRQVTEDDLTDTTAAITHLLTYPEPVFAAAEAALLRGWRDFARLTLDLRRRTDESARETVCSWLAAAEPRQPDGPALPHALPWTEQQWLAFARSHDQLRRRHLDLTPIRDFLDAGLPPRLTVLATLAGLTRAEAEQSLDEATLRTLIALRNRSSF